MRERAGIVLVSALDPPQARARPAAQPAPGRRARQGGRGIAMSHWCMSSMCEARVTVQLGNRTSSPNSRIGFSGYQSAKTPSTAPGAGWRTQRRRIQARGRNRCVQPTRRGETLCVARSAGAREGRESPGRCTKGSKGRERNAREKSEEDKAEKKPRTPPLPTLLWDRGRTGG